MPLQTVLRKKKLDHFHSFTPLVDVTHRHPSAILGRKRLGTAVGVFPDITHTFAELSQVVASVSEKQISQLERFVILLYDKTSECTHVNKARKVFFCEREAGRSHTIHKGCP